MKPCLIVISLVLFDHWEEQASRYPEDPAEIRLWWVIWMMMVLCDMIYLNNVGESFRRQVSASVWDRAHPAWCILRCASGYAPPCCVLAPDLCLCIRCAAMLRVLLLDPEQGRDDSLIIVSFVDDCIVLKSC